MAFSHLNILVTIHYGGHDNLNIFLKQTFEKGF